MQLCGMQGQGVLHSYAYCRGSRAHQCTEKWSALLPLCLGCICCIIGSLELYTKQTALSTHQIGANK
jgi:hypothetical protein